MDLEISWTKKKAFCRGKKKIRKQKTEAVKQTEINLIDFDTEEISRWTCDIKKI